MAISILTKIVTGLWYYIKLCSALFDFFFSLLYIFICFAHCAFGLKVVYYFDWFFFVQL